MMKKFALLFFTGIALLATGAGNAHQERPKVGLVLGGGGALGISHIGILRVLEEERIPIDYIVGTSMGAIIGGLYASGMSPDEIQAFLQGLDWKNVLTDKTPRRELYFRRKQEDQRYLLEVGVDRDGIKYGTGMAAGQKFNNLLQWEVQRTATITDFDRLPIPYRAVATDLMSGEAFVMSRGNLARAMRASMAVPGAFTAVEIEDHLLVDGGIVNNLPVDVVKAMGADVIIAVDVGSKSDKVMREELDSLPGILGRTYSIMQRPEQLELFKQADIGIQPQLDDFTASQFDRVADFIPRGEAAARQHLEELRKLSVDETAFNAFLARHRRPMPTGIRIESVGISGQDRVSEKAIRGRVLSKAGDTLDLDAVKLDLMRIYGIGEFEQILYQLDQETDGVGSLNYKVKEKPWGPLYMAFGLNLNTDFDNDTTWGLLLNLTRRSINGLGAEWRNDLEIGNTQGILSEFYQPIDHGGFIFVAPAVSYYSELQDVYNNHAHIAEYDVVNTEAKFDLGVQLRHYAELRLGPALGSNRGNVEIGTAGLPEFDDDYVALQASLIVDRKDRTYFPRAGYYFALEGFSARDDWGGDVSYDKLFTEGNVHYSLGDHTFQLGLKYGSDLGGGIPAYDQFALGGLENFAGLARYQFRGPTLGVGSVGYSYRLMELPAQFGRGIYVVTRYDVGNVWNGDVDVSDLRHGVAAGLGADTAFGPCYLAFGIANENYQTVYLSIGNAF